MTACQRSVGVLFVLASMASVCRGGSPADVQNVVVPFVTKHCVGCHGVDDPEGGLTLHGFTTDAAILEKHRVWTKVLEAVRSGQMPPREEPRPAADDVGRFSAAVEDVFERYVRSGKRDPGRVVMRRLNKYEYLATIRDLLGVMIPLGDLLPADEVVDGFDNIAESLTISSVHMNAYMEVAEAVMKQAVVFDDPGPTDDMLQWGRPERVDRARFRNLDSSGRLERDAAGKEIPVENRRPGGMYAGTFFFNGPSPVRWQTKAGLPYGARVASNFGEYRLVVRLQGYRVTEGRLGFKVTANGATVLEGECGESVDYHVATFTLDPGPVSIKLYHVGGESEHNKESADPADRNGIILHSIRLFGPLRPTSMQDRLLAAPAGLEGEARSRHVLERFLRRAFRRPPLREEVDRLLQIVRVAEQAPRYRMQEAQWRKLAQAKSLPKDVPTDVRSYDNNLQTFLTKSDFLVHLERALGAERAATHGETILGQAEVGSTPWEAAIAMGMQAAICSPNFLFRVEPDEPSTAPAAQPVDDWSLASRLAYFLWSSMPDDELLELAEKKQLRSNLPAQVTRMLADSRSRGFVENFVAQWLKLHTLASFEVDRTAYPQFNFETRWSPNLWLDMKSSMRAETLHFAHSVIRDNLSVFTFLDGDFTFLDSRLAAHYNIRDTKGNPLRDPSGKPAAAPADPGEPIPEDHFVRVSLAPTGRGGLLTHGSVLTLTSASNRTSPVKRGAWVADRILGAPPPPPPPGVPPLAEKNTSATRTVALSVRESLEQHRARADCAACHARIDPIGFALEHYDAIGQFRATIGGKPVDARGDLPTGGSVEGVDGLKKFLLEQKSVFARALARHMLTYAIGRQLEFYDLPAVNEILARAEKQDYRAHAMILAIVESDPFLMRRTNPEKEGAR